MKMRSYFCCLLIAIISAGSCVEPYQPSVVSQDYKYLVVDAFLNITQGTATVKLSRTLPLYSGEAAPPELNAVVDIESDDGTITRLNGDDKGLYEQTGMAIASDKQYRLLIRTADNTEYQSDFITVKQTPPIDSVYWKEESDGLWIYVNTHDDNGDSRYYKWSYHETWQYSSTFSSTIKLVNGEVVSRPEEEYINRCWGNNYSENILIGSSAKLATDIIDHFPITFVGAGKKLSEKYSILVVQQTITKEAYEYWIQMKQTTESLGSLFDPMPHQLSGNIRNTSSPGTPVFGFFSGGSTQEKRIFITPRDISFHLRVFQRPFCEYDSIPLNEINSYGDHRLLIASYGYPVLLGYLSATSYCIDCRLQGGTTEEPPFWE